MIDVSVEFYSYKPRLRVRLTYETSVIPSIGDTIKIPNEFISEWDKKYFKEWVRDFQMDFKVKERILIIEPPSSFWDSDVYIKLEWTDKEKNSIEKHFNKKRNK